MQPNNLNIKAINPKNGDKYSPNLYKFMAQKHHATTTIYATVYRDKQGALWFGYRDEEGWFMGARMIDVLCNGKKTGTWAHPPRIGQALVEVKGFWQRYIADGRCAIDKAHDMYFVGDKSRWEVKGNRRSCLWCGKVHQKKKLRVVKVRYEEWVTV